MSDLDGLLNGHDRPRPATSPAQLDETRLLEAMEHSHTFPGFYPVVVIGHGDAAFEDRLTTAILLAQAGQPYTVRERRSSHGRYVAYHVELYVASARTALARKAMLAGVEGVLWML
jgi:putative lipoic acid-binding regulatory protein